MAQARRAAFFILFFLLGAAAFLFLNAFFWQANPALKQQHFVAPNASVENGFVVNHVLLTAGGAVPDALFVKLGESVQFNSRDSKRHSIAQGGGDEFNQSHSHQEFAIESGVFGPDEAYRVSFKRTGVYHFHDHLNSKIFVTIVVYAAGNSSAAQN